MHLIIVRLEAGLPDVRHQPERGLQMVEGGHHQLGIFGGILLLERRGAHEADVAGVERERLATRLDRGLERQDVVPHFFIETEPVESCGIQDRRVGVVVHAHDPARVAAGAAEIRPRLHLIAGDLHAHPGETDLVRGPLRENLIRAGRDAPSAGDRGLPAAQGLKALGWFDRQVGRFVTVDYGDRGQRSDGT